MEDLLKSANKVADAMNIEVPTTDRSPYPKAKRDDETYGSYRTRILKLMSDGFDISRLSFGDYTDYCRGNYAPDELEYNSTVAYFENQNS